MWQYQEADCTLCTYYLYSEGDLVPYGDTWVNLPNMAECDCTFHEDLEDPIAETENGKKV